jgi:sRNA-binding regulator protein Hfq
MSLLKREQIAVMIRLVNGSELRGKLSIEQGSRLSDVLNNLKKEFIVLIDSENRPHILNKQHIMEVMELNSDPSL